MFSSLKYIMLRNKTHYVACSETSYWAKIFSMWPHPHFFYQFELCHFCAHCHLIIFFLSPRCIPGQQDEQILFAFIPIFSSYFTILYICPLMHPASKTLIGWCINRDATSFFDNSHAKWHIFRHSLRQQNQHYIVLFRFYFSFQFFPLWKYVWKFKIKPHF